MNLYFDLEFTLLNRYSTPISLGIVTDGNESFYAEFNDFNRNDITDWVRDNVINNLTFKDEILGVYNYTTSRRISPVNVEHCGNTYYIHLALIEWLDSIVPDGEHIEWVGDVAYFDFMILSDILLGGKSVQNTTLKYPARYGNPVYFDVNQAIAVSKNISLNESFDLNRKVLIQGDCSDIVDNLICHDSLHDAITIKALYYKFK